MYTNFTAHFESVAYKSCSIQRKMYAREWDVQKVLYTAQNIQFLECDVQKLLHTAQKDFDVQIQLPFSEMVLN